MIQSTSKVGVVVQSYAERPTLGTLDARLVAFVSVSRRQMPHWHRDITPKFYVCKTDPTEAPTHRHEVQPLQVPVRLLLFGELQEDPGKELGRQTTYWKSGDVMTIFRAIIVPPMLRGGCSVAVDGRLELLLYERIQGCRWCD